MERRHLTHDLNCRYFAQPTVFCNFCDVSEELMERADRWTTPVLILFFVISGAELGLSVFADVTVVVIGIVYIIAAPLVNTSVRESAQG